jgi:hypothetical protein
MRYLIFILLILTFFTFVQCYSLPEKDASGVTVTICENKPEADECNEVWILRNGQDFWVKINIDEPNIRDGNIYFWIRLIITDSQGTRIIDYLPFNFEVPVDLPWKGHFLQIPLHVPEDLSEGIYEVEIYVGDGYTGEMKRGRTGFRVKRGIRV